MTEKKDEIVRPKDVKKSDKFVFCRWAPGDWEANYYYHTDAHVASRQETINSMLNDPAWFKKKAKKLDRRVVAANNKAKGSKRGGKRRSS